MNKYLYIVAIATAMILSSCHKQENSTGPSTIVGKFIVDSIGTTAIVKIDTVTKNLDTYLTFTLVYHFENHPGTLDNISLIMTNSYGVTTSIDYAGPENINDLHQFKDIYKFPDALIGQDSIEILRGLSGVFWIKGSNNDYNFSDRFSWKDSLNVHIER